MSSNNLIAIEAKGLTKRFNIYNSSIKRLKTLFKPNNSDEKDQFTALENVSLLLKKGGTVGIIGLNGAGKTTLLQLICKTLAPDEGELKVNGTVAALLELGAGFNPDFSGYENIYLNAALFGLSRAETEKRIEKILQFAEIGDFINRPVKTYSSGMYVRLAFAVAINVDPDILIVDEALSVGDARFQAKCLKKIKELKAKGTTLLFCSHDIIAIKQFCDHVIWLHRGQVQAYGHSLMVCSKYVQFLFEEESNTNNDALEEFDYSKPINHWGSHIGSISSCVVTGDLHVPTLVYSDEQYIVVKVRFKIPAQADLTTFSVGVTIRNLNGDELFVCLSKDKGIRFNLEQQFHEVEFKFKNKLNSGKYMLVALLEERKAGNIPHYYEFIEGVHYFSVIQNKETFGLFVCDFECSENAVYDT